ncbi:lipoprotein signal peptidase [Porphyromonas circumdentaria]|uniref:Lipoprotein signal peptidase n=1 Tax=Porphyromonas circumdentaria TaxID=29524 RepID=A0A1T4MZ07_9PORP|nr:lipoprotein signal peptidase [Porphyromonas circumdentaria]MBB6275985.1 signal peptidase II [Porphyromonas circumdentaria]MDO4721951.1 lipoprotein signal peptidase [Porphyromonas circumdentaria]SJZ72017.1 signal peptidase II [Porphyromonas circumdentaria]
MKNILHPSSPQTPLSSSERGEKGEGRVRTQSLIVFGGIFLLLLIDQIIKLWVKQNMVLGDQIKVFDWFYIYFVENPGMAYGIEIGSKLFLSLFRIVVMGALCWMIYRLIKEKTFKTGFLLVLALIAAGGIGNIIDSLFYGIIFSSSEGQLATLFPPEGGYGTFLHGKVVDMFYFPLIDCYLPQWLPWIGGKHFTFFDPIFNFADSCISVGVVALILFYRHTMNFAIEYVFRKKEKENDPAV